MPNPSFLASAIPAYFIGIAFFVTGIGGFAFPDKICEVFGLPSDPPATSQTAVEPTGQPTEQQSAPADAAVSPFLYAKSARDLSCGLAFLLLGATGNGSGVSLLAAAVSLTGAADGWIVRRYGGNPWKHWNGTAIMAAWAGWRLWKHL